MGATVLNNADDDHAGAGRIIQYDSNLNEKGVLWTTGTTHLVGGLRFGPDKLLWAFDNQAQKVLKIDPDGTQLPDVEFASRAFSNINFAPDGSVYLGEHLVGDTVKMPPGKELGTTLPCVPGSDRFGDGHVFQFTTDGDLLAEFNTETHGGMAAFLGITSATLAPDGRTLIYLSELGNRVFRYDLAADRQLPDLLNFTPDSGDLAVAAMHQPDGTLLFIKANFQTGFCLQALNDAGESICDFPLAGPGWAALGPAVDSQTVYVGNFFSGELIQLDLDSGKVLARADAGVERSLAGVAQFPG